MKTYAIISTDIRRDLVAPLREFRRLRLLHFYRSASYGDLHDDEFDQSLRGYRGVLDLARQLWQARPDAIQGVDPFVIRLLPLLYAAFLVALLRRVPLVLISLENRPLDIKYGRLRALILRLALWPIFAYASLILYVNDGVRTNLLAVAPCAHKLRRQMYGTWGVDLDEFCPQPDGREPAWGAEPVVLFVGRIAAEKGIFDLLDAWVLLRQQVPSARLVLVGDGPARAEVAQLVAAQGWEREVLLAGIVKNRDLPPLFRAASVFAAPSRTTRKWEEQVGMTNLQALACALPVVSTRSGAIPEYVPDGEAGLLVPEGNPRALAGALATLLASQRLREQLGQGGRTLAEHSYDARANVRAAEELVLHIIVKQ